MNSVPRKHIEVKSECGMRLSLLLKEHHVTQKHLAELLGYEPQHISNIVRGKRRLTEDFAERVSGEIFGDVRPEWLMCRDDFKTEAEKEEFSKKKWEESQKLEVYYEEIFRCFIDSIEDVSGYGLHSQGVDDLIGEFIVVTDKSGQNVGAVPVESFYKLRDEVEHYASYLVHLLIKNEMQHLPITKKGGE